MPYTTGGNSWCIAIDIDLKHAEPVAGQSRARRTSNRRPDSNASRVRGNRGPWRAGEDFLHRRQDQGTSADPGTRNAMRCERLSSFFPLFPVSFSFLRLRHAVHSIVRTSRYLHYYVMDFPTGYRFFTRVVYACFSIIHRRKVGGLNESKILCRFIVVR